MALSPIEQRVKFIFEQEGLDKLQARVQSVNEVLSKHNKGIEKITENNVKYDKSQAKTNKAIKSYRREQEKADKTTKKASKGILDITRSNRLLSTSLAVVRSRILIAAFALRTFQLTVGRLLRANALQIDTELKLANVLRTTGRQYTTSVVSLKKYAAALATTSRHGDELILNSMALLATFKNLTGDTFKEATSISLDLAEVMGTDLKSSAIMVGKALDEPLKGLTALTRVGVSFSEEQREQVKGFMRANELAKAQDVILTALNAQFKGGRSSLSAYTMAQSQLSQAFGDLQEIVGSKIEPFVIPVIREITAFMREFGTESDQTGAFLESLGLSSEVKSKVLLKNAKAEHDAFIEENETLHLNINTLDHYINTKDQAKLATTQMSNAVVFLQDKLAKNQSEIEGTVSFLADKGFFEKKDIESIRAFAENYEKLSKIDLQGSTKTVKENLKSLASSVMNLSGTQGDEFLEGLEDSVAKFMETGANASLLLFDFTKAMGLTKDMSVETQEAFFKLSQPLQKEVINAVLALDEALLNKESIQSRIDTQGEYNALLIDMLMQMGLIEDKTDSTANKFKEFFNANIKGAQLTIQSFGAMTSALTGRLDAEMDALKKSDKFKNASSKQQEEMQENLLKKQASARNRYAKFERASNIANATMNVATAITKAMADTGILAPILTPIIAAMGAFQIAAIASAPIPKFASGGLVGGRRHSQGGTIIEAERGEFVMSRKAVESVGIETMNRINQGGGQPVNISFTGNVMSQDFIEDEAIPMIKEAIRRGADIGVS